MTIFATSVTRLMVDIAGGVRESRSIAVLRDALLPKHTSSVVRVRDAERMIERVA